MRHRRKRRRKRTQANAGERGRRRNSPDKTERSTELTGSKPYILAVEDEPDLLDTVVEDLEEAAYEVHGVGSAEEALSSIEARRPDLVLCDIRLPGEDGLSLMARVRDSDEDAAAIPFVFLTAFDTQEDIVRGKTLGAEDYITKPVNFDELHATLKARLDQMARLHKQMDKRVAVAEQRATLLAEARNELARLAERRLRPAATALLGYAETLVSGTVAPISNDTQRRYLEAMRDAARTVVERIPEIAVLSNAGAIQERAANDAAGQTLDVQKLLGERLTSERIGPAAAIELHTAGPDLPLVPGDPEQFARALDHLAGALHLMMDREAGVTAASDYQNGVVSIAITAGPVDPKLAASAIALMHDEEAAGDKVLHAPPAAVALFAAAALFGMQGAEILAETTQDGDFERLRLSILCPAQDAQAAA